MIYIHRLRLHFEFNVLIERKVYSEDYFGNEVVYFYKKRYFCMVQIFCIVCIL